MKKKVLLVGFKVKEYEIPLEMGYVKAALQKYASIKIKYFDIDTEEKPISDFLRKSDSDTIIWFTDNLINSNIFTLKLALKILSGMDTGKELFIQSYKIDKKLAREILAENDFVNGIIRGEPENNIKELISGMELSNIQGITYRKGNNIVSNRIIEIWDLGSLDSPYLNKSIDPLTYIDYCFAYISTSRGCLFDCFFCDRSNRFNSIRYFPVERILEEIRFLWNKGVRRIIFTDDSFITNQLRFKDLANKISKMNHIKIKFVCMVRQEFLNDENIKLLKMMNMKEVCIGIQTTNPNILNSMNRSFDSGRYEKMIRLLDNAGIRKNIDLILGLPGDDLEGFKRSLENCTKANPDEIRVMKLYIHPKTIGHFKEENIVFDKSRLDRFTPIIKSSKSFSEDDLNKAISHLIKIREQGFNIKLIPEIHSNE
ncbi:radical SAM protein [Candidatus Woesearchaeota archaeon]|nr:radical SAM protein [Candidatus Woesearchaeota archaeon]